MDKKSEQKASHKKADDIDIGTHDYGAGGVREQLNGLWGIASEKVVGLSPTRIITNDYCKKEGKSGVNVKKGEGKDIIDSLLESGPPLMNMSKPHRIF